MDPDILGGVMRLMKTVDLDSIVRDVQGSGGGDNIDAMISTVTKSMLKGMQTDGGAHTITVSISDAHRGKRRRIRVKTDEGAHTYDVDVPPRCADRHTVSVDTPHGAVAVLVRVAEREGAFTRHDHALCTRVPVSLRDTLELRLDVELPWGERVRIHECDAAHRPVSGWRVVRGGGMYYPDGTRGDLFVRLDVVLPDTWDGVDLSRIDPLNAHAPDAEATPVSVALVPADSETDRLSLGA
jgi:DnaJ-class molecular chaperone